MCLSPLRYRCKVLGHQVRSNIHRPREQLFVPLLRDFDFDGPDQDDDGEPPLVLLLHNGLSLQLDRHPIHPYPSIYYPA